MPPGRRRGLFPYPLSPGWPCILLWLVAWGGCDPVRPVGWSPMGPRSFPLSASGSAVTRRWMELACRRGEWRRTQVSLAASLQCQICVQSSLGIPAPVKPPDDCGLLHDFRWAQPKNQPAEAHQNHWFPESQSNKGLLYEATRFCGNMLCRKRWLVLEKSGEKSHLAWPALSPWPSTLTSSTSPAVITGQL